MALNLDTAIRLSAQVQGANNIRGVATNLQQLNATAQLSGRQLDKLYTETQRFAAAAGGSINAIRQQRTALDTLRNAVDPASRRFQVLSQDIANLDAKLKQAESTAAAFSLASALKTAAAGASVSMVSFAGMTASAASVSTALQRMGVSSEQAEKMIQDLQGQMEQTGVSAQKLNLTLNQALASTPEKAARQINTMRQALAQQKAGSDEYLATLVRINEAEAVMQARAGRAGVIAGARAYQGATLTSGYGSAARLPSMPNTMAADMQRVAELTGRIRNLDRATDEYRRSLQELEVVQARLNRQPNRLDVRGALGSAAGAAVMGGGPGAMIGAAGGSLAAAGGPAGLAVAGGLAAAAGLTVQSVANARELEAQSRRLRVMTDDAAALQAQIIGLVREQGHLTSTTEASAAAYEILQAGFSGTDEIVQVLRASTLGAVGGFTEMKVVADALTSVLNGYGMTAADAARVVDQMKAATDDGKISMEQYAQSIGRVIPSAAAAKVSFEEINAAVSALTAQGVPVESTFSGINQILKTIIKPTKEASDRAAELGLEFNAQALAAKGLGGLLADVAAKTGKSSDALGVLFSDIDGYKAVVALLNDDLQRFNKFTDNQADALGRAGEAARKAVDPVVQFDNAWKDLTSTLGQLVLPTLNDVLQGLTTVLQRILEMPEALKGVGYQLAQQLPLMREFTAVMDSVRGVGALVGLGGSAPQGQRNAAQRLAGAGSTLTYTDAQGNTYDTTTGRMVRPAARTPLPADLPTTRTLPPAATGRTAGTTSRAGGAGSSWQPSSRARALMAAAQKLGVSPLDLATIISFETGGTFNPSIFGGAGGRYMGLIQFGPPERQRYGANQRQTFEEQVTGPVVRYFEDRFAGAGMSTKGASLLDLYTTVLAGNPKANRNSRDSFGTSPSSGVAAMGPHRQKALATFFGGSMANVGFDANDRATVMAEAFDEQMRRQQELAEKTREQLNAAQSLSVERERELHVLEAVDELEKRRREYEVQRLERIEAYRQLYADSLSDQERGELMLAQADEARRDQLVFEKDTTELRKKAQEENLRLMEEQATAAQVFAEALQQSLTYMQELSTRQNVGVGLQQGVDGYVESLGHMRDATAQLATTGLKGLEDQMVALATTGKANYREFAVSVLESTARMIIQQMVMRTLLQAIGAIGGGGTAASFEMPSAGFPTSGFTMPGGMPIMSRAGGGYTGDGPRSGGLDGQGGFLAVLHPRETVIDHHRGQVAAAAGPAARELKMPEISFAGGGYTGDSPRSGGLDGQGGFLAMLHPRETVIDHHKGQAVAAGPTSVTVIVNAETGERRMQADSQAARRLGDDLANAVDARIVHLMRPGGLLHSGSRR